MKRKTVAGNNSFARFGLRPHRVRTTKAYRGGIRV